MILFVFFVVNKRVRDETLDDFMFIFQEKTSNSSSGFVVTDFIMPAREKPVSHPPSDPPLCESVSFFLLIKKTL